VYHAATTAIRKVRPDYAAGFNRRSWLPSVIDLRQFPPVLASSCTPTVTQTKQRRTTQAYLGIVARTNFKQRALKMLSTTYADRSTTPSTDAAPAGVHQGVFVKPETIGVRQADRPPL